MSLPHSTTVLIVGAGPTGMAAALSLLEQGQRDFVMVDAVAEGQNTSRALVVHAATLEALDEIHCADALVASGRKTEILEARNRVTDLFHADFASLAPYTRYPFALVIPQQLTERALGEKLKKFGVKVYRPVTVVGLKRSEKDSALTDVSFEGGQVIQARYVIGADGAHSVIRNAAGIGFTDPDGVTDRNKTITQHVTQIALADLTFTSDPPISHLTAVLSGSFFIMLPLPNTFKTERDVSGTLYRVACGVPEHVGTPPHAPPKEYMQQLLDHYGPLSVSSDPSVNKNPVEIDDVVWSSRFRTHSAIADRFFTRLGSMPGTTASDGGVIMLVGDAAHIHSPAGGQGMNLGLRDAVALGKAVAEHIKASQFSSSPSEADSVLENFAFNRHAQALVVIHLTKRILDIIGMTDETRLSRFFWWSPIGLATIRDWTIWALGLSSRVRSGLAWELSGLANK